MCSPGRKAFSSQPIDFVEKRGASATAINAGTGELETNRLANRQQIQGLFCGSDTV
jgi:hypothetical protein